MFAHICEEMETKHKILSHWCMMVVQRSCIVSCVWAENAVIQLLQYENKTEFSDLLQNQLWSTILAYLCDISELFNRTSTSMQWKDENILTSTHKITALKDILNIWNRKVKKGNFELCLRTSKWVLISDIKDSICSHAKLLAEKLDKHVPIFKISEYDWLRNKFTWTEISSLSPPKTDSFDN
jgi:hypothetical protein